jgi:hypothetical protein
MFYNLLGNNRAACAYVLHAAILMFCLIFSVALPIVMWCLIFHVVMWLLLRILEVMPSFEETVAPHLLLPASIRPSKHSTHLDHLLCQYAMRRPPYKFPLHPAAAQVMHIDQGLT